MGRPARLMLNPALSADRWRRYYPQLKAFHAVHGHILVPGGRLEALRRWLQSQVAEARSTDYSPKRRALLEALGFEFDPPIDNRVWNLRMSQLREHIVAKGTWRVGDEEPELQAWLSTARRHAREGSIPPNLVCDLEALGVSTALLPRGRKSAPAAVALIPPPATEEYGADWDAAEAERPR